MTDIFERIKKMSDEELRSLTRNAQVRLKKGNEKQKLEADKALQAIEGEIGNRHFPGARKRFCERFPDGFYDEQYLLVERNYKFDAHQQILDLLDEQEYRNLLAEENYSEIVARLKKIVNKTNLIFSIENAKLNDALGDNQKQLCQSIFDLLYGKGSFNKKFDHFAEICRENNVGNWTICTYFLFFRYPDKYIFVKPDMTRKAAEICQREIAYSPEVNSKTYQKILQFSKFLMTKLDDLKPRDCIDIQSFMWCIAPTGTHQEKD